MVVVIAQGGNEVDMSTEVDSVGWHFVRRINVLDGYLDADTASCSHSKRQIGGTSVFIVTGGDSEVTTARCNDT